MAVGDRRHSSTVPNETMIPASTSAHGGHEQRRSRMAEKRIQPKAAKTDSAKGATAAAGVQKKSLKKTTTKKLHKKH
jgi:hypothetical protein